jgi:hydroxymethylglutaryl-CoA lyase
MAFGNPFGDAWDIDEVVSAVDLLVDLGVAQVSLSDTAGTASAAQVRDVVACVLGVHEGLEVGVHLRSRAGEAADKVRAAFEAGCRRFDATIGGVGGILPGLFQPEALVGNLPTELLLATLKELSAALPEIEPLDRLTAAAREIERRFGAVKQ